MGVAQPPRPLGCSPNTAKPHNSLCLWPLQLQLGMGTGALTLGISEPCNQSSAILLPDRSGQHGETAGACHHCPPHCCPQPVRTPSSLLSQQWTACMDLLLVIIMWLIHLPHCKLPGLATTIFVVSVCIFLPIGYGFGHLCYGVTVNLHITFTI